jgi:hypothetical protein
MTQLVIEKRLPEPAWNLRATWLGAFSPAALSECCTVYPFLQYSVDNTPHTRSDDDIDDDDRTMMSFWASAMGSGSGGGTGGSGGGVSFNATIQVVNADDTISIRHMNPHGGYYDTEMDMETYDEDGSLSFNLDASQTDDDGLSFLDAVQDLVDHADATAAVTGRASSPTATSDNDDDDDVDGPDNDYFQSSGYEPKEIVPKCELVSMCFCTMAYGNGPCIGLTHCVFLIVLQTLARRVYYYGHSVDDMQ